MAYPSPSHFSRSRSRQPALQKGAKAWAAGLAQSGQRLDLGTFAIASGDGESGVGAQAYRAADLGGQGVRPGKGEAGGGRRELGAVLLERVGERSRGTNTELTMSGPMVGYGFKF